METENAYKEISEMLSEIKSNDGGSNVLDLLSKLLDTKIELDNDQLYTDQFEDISLKIKKNGFYIKDSLKRESLLKYLEDYSNILNEIKEYDRIYILWDKYIAKRVYAQNIKFGDILSLLLDFLNSNNILVAN